MNAPRARRDLVEQRFSDFIAGPVSPEPLGVLRMGVALLLLAQAWSLADHVQLLFGDGGLAPWNQTDPTASRWVPRLATAVYFLQQWGLSAKASIAVLTSTYVLGLVGLMLGWRTRGCAVGVWVLHTLLISTGSILTYGLDAFAHISLFYCAVMPVGAAFSLDQRAGRVSGAPSPEITLSLRVLQLHLCIVYFRTGIEKAVGPAWQNGEAVWQALMQPQFARYDFAWLASMPWLVKALTWGTLVVELGYPFFIWPRQTRALWVLLTLGLHVGIALFMRLWIFGGIMCVLTFAAFGWESFKPLLLPWTRKLPPRGTSPVDESREPTPKGL